MHSRVPGPIRDGDTPHRRSEGSDGTRGSLPPPAPKAGWFRSCPPTCRGWRRHRCCDRGNPLCAGHIRAATEPMSPDRLPSHSGERHGPKTATPARPDRRLQNDVAVPIVGGHIRQRIAEKGPHVETAERFRAVLQAAVKCVGAQKHGRRPVAIQECVQDFAVSRSEAADG